MHPLLSRSRALLAASTVLLVSACEYPTSAPSWDMRWNVPVSGTSIAVADLLPANITVAPQNTAFLVTVDPVSISRTLSQDCAQCAAATGTTAPKPAFTVDQRNAAALPGDLVSAVLSGGSIGIAINHNFTFDPIRVSSAAGATQGSLDVIVRSNGQIIGQRRLHGDTATLAAGVTRTISVPLTAGSTLGSSVEVQVVLVSPAGDPVMMDASRSFNLTATPTGLAVSRADVRIASKSVSSGDTELDLTDVESDVADRLISGNVILQINNPLAIGGTMSLRLTGGGVDITRTFALQSQRSTVTLAFSKAEIQSLFGKLLTVSASGTVSGTGAGNVVQVTPSQVIEIDTRMDITLCTSDEADACTP
jgi:hypothetical protein